MELEVTPAMIEAARARLVEWLAYPTELGDAPEQIEYLDAVEVEDASGPGVVLAFRFRVVESTELADRGWMVGITGPYRSSDTSTVGTWLTFSRFESQDSAPLDDLIDANLKTLVEIRDMSDQTAASDASSSSPKIRMGRRDTTGVEPDICEIAPAEKTCWIAPSDQDFQRYNAMAGEVQGIEWAVPGFEKIHGRRVDLPWCSPSSLIALTDRARDVLEMALSPFGEFLPVDTDGERMWLYNCLTVCDALDENASEIARFAGGRIMAINDPVIDLDKTDGADVFRLSALLYNTYISRRVFDVVTENALTGWDLVPVRLSISASPRGDEE